MRSSVAAILLILLFPFISDSQVYNQIQKIVAFDRASGDIFGVNVSVSGNYAIVGAQNESEDSTGLNTLPFAGAAYIYEKDSTEIWVQKQKIVPADRTGNDYFGGSVAISGDYAIVGAFEKDAIGGNFFSHAGAVYIFERNSYGLWTETKKLVATDTGANDHYGYAVSISNGYAVVGSPIDGEDANGINTLNSAGSAYIYERDGNGNWNQVQKLVSSDRAIADLFGASASISGNYAIIGAYKEDEDTLGANTLSDAGSCYIFERDGNGNWNETKKIVSSDRAVTDRFGISVSLSGTYAIVGAYLEDEDEAGINTINAAGSAYIFERDGNGNWIQIKKITAPSADRNPNDYFGASVFADGNKVIVGAYHEGADANGGNLLSSSGAAYIYKRNGNGNWNLTQKIAASDRATSDLFGAAVAISGDNIIVGAYGEDEDSQGGNPLNASGSAYLYQACLSNSSTLNRMTCSSFLSPSGQYIWSNSGTYMDTIPNSIGCDSVITVVLTINSSNSVLNKTVCNSYTSPSGLYTWTTSNSYSDTIPNFKNCDSVITINLTVNNSFSTLNETACVSYVSPSGSYTWTNSNTYLDTIPNSKGCDSVITINLTVNNLDVSVSQNGATLTATTPGASYQWLDCNNANSIIAGENSQQLTALNNGNYSVSITKNNCNDTSSCNAITITGLLENMEENLISISPNPANTTVTVAFKQFGTENSIVELLNTTGQIIYSQTLSPLPGKYDLKLKTDDLAKGIYLIVIKNGSKQLKSKLIIDR